MPASGSTNVVADAGRVNAIRAEIPAGPSSTAIIFTRNKLITILITDETPIIAEAFRIYR